MNARIGIDRIGSDRRRSGRHPKRNSPQDINASPRFGRGLFACRFTAFGVAYQSSPGRPDITDWPDGVVDAQITTDAKMASIILADGGPIAQKQREWMLKWQGIMLT
jgi:hypothetical protein